MARRNSAESVRQQAVEHAKAGKGITSCPYKHKSPYQAVWLKAFVREAQLDWVSAAR